jgi:hypothetical protein
VSGLEFLRTLLDWCVSAAPSRDDEAIKNQHNKKKRALWLVGVENKNADNASVRLGGTTPFIRSRLHQPSSGTVWHVSHEPLVCLRFMSNRLAASDQSGLSGR